MPQLMPMYWALSVFMVVFLLTMALFIYMNIMNLNYVNNLNLYSFNYVWLW